MITMCTTKRMSGGRVRQLGFQETPIVEMVKPITKYAYTCTQPLTVISVLVECLRYMNDRRPGPGLVDIPDDIQRAEL